MIFIGILASIAAIGMLCWLLFTLAIFALPLFAGVAADIWAYGIGQLLLAFVRPQDRKSVV